MLYHWSPVARRASILRHGLCPRKKSWSIDQWRPPYLCFSRTPSMAWGQSAVHSGKTGAWDLWCVWSSQIGPYATVNPSKTPRKDWHTTEYRSFRRISIRHVWHVGVRAFRPCKRGCRGAFG